MTGLLGLARAGALGLAVVAVGGCGGGSGGAGGPDVPRVTSAPALGPLTQSGAGHRFYEIYEPPGRPRGTMLVFHGGGWRAARGDARRQTAAASLAFRDRGWRVVNASYSPGPRPGGRVDPRPMLRDVVAFYDQIRRAYPGPVCAYGESAGGHLAALLAVERPALNCLILASAPLDLPSLLRTSAPVGQAAIRATFGNRPSVLQAWSPARLWGPAERGVDVFATGSTNDTIVNASQLRTFTARAPGVAAAVLPGAPAGSPDAVPWMHSVVHRAPLERRLAALATWLKARGTQHPAVPAAVDIGADCGPDSHDSAGSRWRLLRAGDAWEPTATAGAPLAATRGCSGTARWQDDGLSLWAFPGPVVLPQSDGAALTLDVSPGLRHLTAVFRGFLIRPRQWAVGLYSSRRETGAITTRVATCERGTCRGLRLARTRGGALVAGAGTTGDPDRRATPAPERFTLPPGTRRVAWRLRCVASAGCALAGSTTSGGAPLRRRDPLGHPAIFSVYRVTVD